MTNTQLALLMDRFTRRMHSALHAKAPRFDIDKIGPLGGMVLMALADSGPVSMIALTQNVARDKSQMTRIVRSLEGKGLIARKTSPSDARVSIVSLTDRGEVTVARLRSVLAETLNELLAPVTHAEKQTLAALFSRALDGPSGVEPGCPPDRAPVEQPG